MKSANVELHIEELVLHGFAPGDRYRISEAVQRELTRMFAEQGAPPSFSDSLEAAHIDAGAFNVAPGSKSETIGTQVAQAVYGGLSK